jgi:hypothetical protein
VDSRRFDHLRVCELLKSPDEAFMVFSAEYYPLIWLQTPGGKFFANDCELDGKCFVLTSCSSARPTPVASIRRGIRCSGTVAPSICHRTSASELCKRSVTSCSRAAARTAASSYGSRVPRFSICRRNGNAPTSHRMRRGWFSSGPRSVDSTRWEGLQPVPSAPPGCGFPGAAILHDPRSRL